MWLFLYSDQAGTSWSRSETSCDVVLSGPMVRRVSLPLGGEKKISFEPYTNDLMETALQISYCYQINKQSRTKKIKCSPGTSKYLHIQAPLETTSHAISLAKVTRKIGNL